MSEPPPRGSLVPRSTISRQHNSSPLVRLPRVAPERRKHQASPSVLLHHLHHHHRLHPARFVSIILFILERGALICLRGGLIPSPSPLRFTCTPRRWTYWVAISSNKPALLSILPFLSLRLSFLNLRSIFLFQYHHHFLYLNFYFQD